MAVLYVSVASISSGSKAFADTSHIRKRIVEEDEEEGSSISLPGTAEPSLCCGGCIPGKGSMDEVCSEERGEGFNNLILESLTWKFRSFDMLRFGNVRYHLTGKH